MDGREVVSKPFRKDLRKLRLMEYLAAKGKQKPPNPKPYPREEDIPVKKPNITKQRAGAVNGKENQAPNVQQKNRNDVKAIPPQPPAVLPGRPQHVTVKQRDSRPSHLAELGQQPLATITYSIASIRAKAASDSQSIMQSAADAIKQANCPSSTQTSRAKVNPTSSKANGYPTSCRANTNPSSRGSTTANTNVIGNRANANPISRASSKATANPLSSKSNANSNPPSNFRISLGPLVKTKTGLMPAVVQPRITWAAAAPGPLTVTAAPRTTASGPRLSAAASRARSDTASSTASRARPITASTASRARPITASSTASRARPITAPSTASRAQRNTTTTTSVDNPSRSTTTTLVNQAHPTTTTIVNQAHPTTTTASSSSVARTSRLATTSTTDLGPVHVRSATAPPPLPVPPAVQRKRTPTAATGNRKPTAPPRDQERLSTTSRVSMKAIQPKPTSLQPRPGLGRTWTCIPAASQNQWPNLALTRAMHDAVDQFVTEGEPATKSNAPCVVEADVFSVPPTASRCHRKGRVQGEAPPLTEERGPTAAQQKQMKKLQEWREAKGISYKRPPMTVRPRRARRTVALPQPYWASIEHEEQTQALVSAVETTLADCIKLLDEGCPPQQVQGVLAGLPSVAQRFSKYWICRVRLSELQGELHVLPLFEEAVRLVLQPVDELRTVVFDIMKKTDEDEAQRTDPEEEEESPEKRPSGESTVTPKPLRAFIQGEQDSSSVVKYKITSTPGCFRRQQREPARVNGQELRFFTPVRRSVRIEQASLHYPGSLQEHDLCVTSYNDLMAREEDEEGEGERGVSCIYVYRENDVLRGQVHIQLYHEEEEEEEEKGGGKERTDRRPSPWCSAATASYIHSSWDGHWCY